MENRFQHIFLVAVLLVIMPVFANAQVTDSSANKTAKVKSEFLEFGLNAGILNLEDFPSEYTIGANLTFRATEDFFLQVNYTQASDVDFSSAEKGPQGPSFTGSDRDFEHYNLLLGYNFFQGEFFTTGSKANLSSLHLVGGVGETEFGGESSFTYVLGVGYKVAFKRRYIVNFDVRDYIYEFDSTSGGDDEDTTNNIHVSLGLSYLF